MAFGVTEMVTEQEPALTPFTDVPDKLQNFFDEAASASDTFAPAGMVTFAAFAITVRLMSLPTRTAGAVVVVVGAIVVVAMVVVVVAAVPSVETFIVGAE